MAVKVSIHRSEVTGLFRAREEIMEWGDLPEKRWIRLSDDSAWYVRRFSPDGEKVEMYKGLGGDKYVGPYPEGDVRMIVRHDNVDLDEKEDVAPWRFVELPHGVESYRRHFLQQHGEYMETFMSWQEMTRLHAIAHITMKGGNGFVPHTHKEPLTITWK